MKLNEKQTLDNHHNWQARWPSQRKIPNVRLTFVVNQQTSTKTTAQMLNMSIFVRGPNENHTLQKHKE